MIYEWRCQGCGRVIEIQRPACDYNKEPDTPCTTTNECAIAGWKRKISLSNPDFETMRDKGILERLEKWT